MFLPNNFSFEAISSVGYSADSELALYPTALIQNQCCIRQRWFTNFYLRIQISPRIRNRIRKYFRMLIRGPYGVNFCKKNSGKKSPATVPLTWLKICFPTKFLKSQNTGQYVHYWIKLVCRYAIIRGTGTFQEEFPKVMILPGWMMLTTLTVPSVSLKIAQK